MYSTTAYLYQQITRVLLIDTSGAYFTMRYNPVYSKKLTIAKGVDNVLLFEFINQDQKPVNITGSSFVFRLISQDGADLLLSKDMVVLSAALGRIKVTLNTADTTLLQAQPASYSISKNSAGLTTAVFTDAQAGARADIDIQDSIYPGFVPSVELSIPTTELTARASYGGAGPGQYPDWSLQGQGYGYGSSMPYVSYQTQEYYSSFIEPNSAITTIQMDLLNYTGTIKAQGATTYQSIWYNATESTTYYNKSGPIYLNVIGWHPLIRLAFNNSIFATTDPPGLPATATATVVDGIVTGISITNPGSGYLAAPSVDIIGDGAGAIVTATISDGQVATMTIVNGGSGYRPNPPTMTAALVSINTGYVVNILYR